MEITARKIVMDSWVPKQRVLAAATSIYLTLPAILFAYGWLRWPYAILSVALLVSSIVVASADMVRAYARCSRFARFGAE